MMIAARNSFLMSGAIGPVPTGFRLVKYITRISGNVWFPTGVYNDSAWSLSMLAKLPGNASLSFLFGAFYANANWQGYGLYYNFGTSSRAVHGNKYGNLFGTDLIITSDNIMQCSCTANSCAVSWNGVTSIASSTVGLNNAEIYLLGNGVSRTAGAGHGIGETVIQRNNAEVAHLYPCIRVSDNKPVYWDSVAQVARENTGTGTAGVVELD